MIKTLGIKRRMLVGFDNFVFPWYLWLIRKNLFSRSKRTRRVFIIGGGQSKECFENSFDRQNSDFVAYTNYTRCNKKNISVDCWLASDPFIFRISSTLRTIAHLKKLNPSLVIIPSRAIFSFCGLYLFLRYKCVVVRYYGEKVWNMDLQNRRVGVSLSDVVMSFDTVPFEFGLPLSNDLRAETVFFAGVDFTYGGQEDATSFRRQWRQNITDGIKKFAANNETMPKFRAYPGCENEILDILSDSKGDEICWPPKH